MNKHHRGVKISGQLHKAQAIEETFMQAAGSFQKRDAAIRLLEVGAQLLEPITRREQSIRQPLLTRMG